MKTVLKVVGGKNDGREIAISVPKFIIGRGEKAHLKPSSDLVSRHHCVIRVSNGRVVVEDLKSRNGTFVNGVKLEDPHVAKSGDSLRVGRLQLEIVIDHVVAGAKRPAVKGVAEAAARTVSSKSARKNQSLEDSVSDWLSDDDDDEQPSVNTQRKINNAETIQLSMDDTNSFGKTISEEADSSENDATISDASIADGSEEEPSTDSKKKSKYGKLPARALDEHECSKSAADDVLRKFFHRR